MSSFGCACCSSSSCTSKVFRGSNGWAVFPPSSCPPRYSLTCCLLSGTCSRGLRLSATPVQLLDIQRQKDNTAGEPPTPVVASTAGFHHTPNSLCRSVSLSKIRKNVLFSYPDCIPHVIEHDCGQYLLETQCCRVCYHVN